MERIDLSEMKEAHFDVLKEIGNIGAGNATTALAQLLNRKVDMRTPKVETLEFSELPDIIGGAENVVVSIVLTFSGDFDGMMMFILEKKDAHMLVNLLMGKELKDFDEFTEMDLSALKEIGNILTGAYLLSLCKLMKVELVESVPYLAIDMAGAILSVPAIQFGKIADRALFIQSEFGDKIRGEMVSGYFVLIPELQSYKCMLEKVGITL